MTRVLVTDTLSEEGLAVLRRAEGLTVDYQPGLDEEGLVKAIPGAAALIIRSGTKVTSRVLDAASELCVIGRAGIDVRNVDVTAASKHGVVVMNTPTISAASTAEHAIALLLSLARMIPAQTALLKSGVWDRHRFNGQDLAGKTLGIIGLGNIGRIVAELARGLRMKVIGHDPMLSAERAAKLDFELVTLDEIWSRADAITVHVPLTESTKNLVNAEVVGKLKKGALLVNCARGGVFDETALLAGLESGQIGGIALDVFSTEPPPLDAQLLKHERVIATPHVGASSIESRERMAVEIAEHIVAYFSTGAVQNAINVPSVEPEDAKQLAPYLELAEKIGRFLAQVEAKFTPSVIEVECVGAAAGLNVTAISASAAAGFLQRYAEAPVNPVSAPHIAADRGIKVCELKNPEPDPHYASLVELRIQAEDGAKYAVWGTIGADGTPRLVRWRDYVLEARLGGHALVVTSRNKPGMIGMLGTTLGEAELNVTRVHLGLSGAHGAASIWNLDSPIPAHILDAVRKAQDISSAIAIEI